MSLFLSLLSDCPQNSKIVRCVFDMQMCVDQQLLFETIFALRSVTYSMRRMSYRLCGCLLAGTRWNVPASKQPQNLYDIHLILYVQS